MAETYHIYDYRQLPASQVAVFAYGLREDSRVRMALSNHPLSLQDTMLVEIADSLAWLVWSKTKDGQKNINRPQSKLKLLLGDAESSDKDIVGFETGEDYERYRQALLSKQIGGDANGD